MDRIGWSDLPTATRAAVEERAGPVVRAETAPHGVMSRLACTIWAGNVRVFVKGTRTDDDQAWVYRHEARVTEHAPCTPRVLWEVEAGGWQLYGYEYVEGRYPDLSPGSGDLARLMGVLALMSERPWPEELRKKPLHTRWTGFLPEPAPPGLQGRELAHTDLSPHNMLVTAGGLVLLDWALACPAPGWADAALAVPRLISAGHTPEQAERVARQVPSYRAADPDDLNLFARTLLNAWEAWERTRPMAHRAALTAAAREWAVHRGTNPFPE
ncbi:hypothetical protein [Streptomyces bauhiniae]|uniref:hypothetical protein n=1 Tax=Streptomyces bauhiniae TaxID=2340725 RepID=UPI0035DE6EA7